MKKEVSSVMCVLGIKGENKNVELKLNYSQENYGIHGKGYD